MEQPIWGFETKYRTNTKLVLLGLIWMAGGGVRGRTWLGNLAEKTGLSTNKVFDALGELEVGGHLATVFDKYEGGQPNSETWFRYTLYPKANRPAIS